MLHLLVKRVNLFVWVGGKNGSTFGLPRPGRKRFWISDK